MNSSRKDRPLTSSSLSRTLLPRLANAPLPLLILTGTLLGSMLPMARVARSAGWSPLAFAFWPALGSGLILAAAGTLAGGRARALRPFLLYSLIAGALSVAIPNTVTFLVMPDLGTSLASLMYTLPPLLTYAIAWSIGIEHYRPLRLAGIVLGLAGAALLALSRSSAAGGSPWWIGVALCAPLSLAAGNVYRKQHMPEDADSRLLAGGMLLGGALSLLPFLYAAGDLSFHNLSGWAVILVQCLFTSMGYVVYFRFQKVADAVYFSQVGYLISATGVFSGILFFDERLTNPALLAVAAIASGIAMLNRSPRETRA